MSASPLNFSQECTKLTQLLKQYSMDSNSMFVHN